MLIKTFKIHHKGLLFFTPIPMNEYSLVNQAPGSTSAVDIPECLQTKLNTKIKY